MNFEQLVGLCGETHAALQAKAARVVHAGLAARNWLFGWYIVEYQQNGEDRAAYGSGTLKTLAAVLRQRVGKGFSVDSLEQMRRFYLAYPALAEPWMKSETLSRISGTLPLSETPSRKSAPLSLPVHGMPEGTSGGPLRAISPDWLGRFTLGWSHYVELLTIDSAEERSFYEIEAAANQWSVRELQRQIASSLYGPVNYFDRHVKLADELPTLGIVLCHRKNDALVELTLPENANIFASRYELYLPSKEELKTRLEQITRELEGSHP